MTLLSVFSIKGAPGVTTLSSLLAAALSASGSAILVEADPAGGDLAARFGLSSRVGWVSLASSTRRSEGSPLLTDHLQLLPGGLPVLVGARGDDRRSADSKEGIVVRIGAEEHPMGPVADGSVDSPVDGPPVGLVDSPLERPVDGPHPIRSASVPTGLSVVDLGRYAEGDTVTESWLRRSDASIVVVPGDASAAVILRDRAPRLLDACGGRLGLVVVGGSYGCTDMAAFTGASGIYGIADLPKDPTAAAAACGMPGSGRRLEASLLWAAVGKLADSLSHRLDDGWPMEDDRADSEESVVDPGDSAPPMPRGRRSRRPGRRSSFGRRIGWARAKPGQVGGGPSIVNDLDPDDQRALDVLDTQEALPRVST